MNDGAGELTPARSEQAMRPNEPGASATICNQQEKCRRGVYSIDVKSLHTQATAMLRESAFLIALLLVLAGAGAPIAAADPSEKDSEFAPASTVEKVQTQMRRLPTDDIWWTVNGEDMAWNFKNLHQIFPTVNVYRNGPVNELASRPMPAIGEYIVDTPEGEMSFDEFITSDQSTTMGIVVLHEGDIVYERYPRMEEYEKPVYWSTSKIFPATIIRLLEERGKIDVSKPIDHYIPKLAGSGFAGTSVRHILDMASGLDCSDEYESWDSCYYLYSMAIGDGFRTEDAPDNPYDFAATYEAVREAPPGTKFSYSGLNTFVLGWLVEEIMDMPFQDAFSKEIWYHIGAEADASYIAPRYGIAVTHGGFVSRMRDLALIRLVIHTELYRGHRSADYFGFAYRSVAQWRRSIPASLRRLYPGR